MNEAAINIFDLSNEAKDAIKSKNEHKEKILHFINNENLFRIGDTNVSWRNAVYLEKVNLLKEKDSKSGWRKLSFLDVVYFDLLVELRGFGLQTKKLLPLKRAFYETPDRINNVFLAAFYGYEITLIIFNDGSGYIFDPQALINFEKNARKRLNKPRVTLEINPYINKALSLLNMPKIKVSQTAQSITEGSNE